MTAAVILVLAAAGTAGVGILARLYLLADPEVREVLEESTRKRRTVAEHHCAGCDYSTRWALDLWEHLTHTGHRKAYP